MLLRANSVGLIMIVVSVVASWQTATAAAQSPQAQDPKAEAPSEQGRSTDPKALAGGPPAGTKLPACAVYAPSGPFAGKEFDAATQVGMAPAAFLFVNELTRNTAPMITGLDQLGIELAWTGLQTHLIRIAADRNDAEAAVKRSSAAMKLARPIVVSIDGVDGPGGYALNRQATLTLILAKDGKVVRSIGFTDTGRGDLGKLRKLVEEVTGPVPKQPDALRSALEQRLPTDAKQLRALTIELALLLQRSQQSNSQQSNRSRSQMQRGRAQGGNGAGRSGTGRSGTGRDRAGGNRQGQNKPPAGKPRQGKAPQDAELLALLRRAIQKAAAKDELDAVFAAVDKRVGENAELRSQAVEMFKLQASLEYGNEYSQKRAKAYVKKHGSK
tara:strand:- start:7308 stop:8462 length:1155 start_codon:yes stop_codon:yes gene_type:complete